MKGEAVYFFAFDIANELLPDQAIKLLGERVTRYVLRSKHAAPQQVTYYRPLSVAPPPLNIEIAGRPLRVETRLYEVGVVSILMRLEFEAAAIGELRGLHHPTLPDNRTLSELARELCATLRQEIESALVRHSPLSEPEAYTAFCLYDLGPATDAERWVTEQRVGVAGLLADVPADRLAESQVEEACRQRRSWEKSDAVVIHWEAALVIELGGQADDVLFTLELANLQLEEFRRLDAALDNVLNQAYLDLERRSIALFGISTAVLRKLRWFRVDHTKLADEVINITKFFGDWHLARVYFAARERFHLDQWRSSVDQRLAQLDQLYNVFHTELTERRMFWVEMVVVALIALDLLALMLRSH